MRKIIVGIALLVLVVIMTGYGLVRGSLPVLEGNERLHGLVAGVSVDRDDLGVVTIRGRTRADVTRALGFVHAQDRFFQMDLMRRDAAGELAGLVGGKAVPRDEARRVHRLRQTAREVVKRVTESERKAIKAYTEGVNAGLRALTVRPFEYLLLFSDPEPWRFEDTILAIFAMYFQLNDDDGIRDKAIARLHHGLSFEMFQFLAVSGTSWDAPLTGAAVAVPPVPGPQVCDLHGGQSAGAAEEQPPAFVVRGEAILEDDEAIQGSNGWAVAASHSASGRAMLANDMHLGLRVPNTWYRARLIVTDSEGSGPSIDVSGLTLPGTPAVVAGSNGRIAWGFTNSRGDWSDLVVLELDPGNPERYRTPGGFRAFDVSHEQIAVRGSEPVALRVRSTIWGPVIGKDHRGRLQALRWLAHSPEATNLNLVQLEGAGDVHAAIRIAHRSGMPPQNLVVADVDGNIAWTIMGRIPHRTGYDSRLPVSWANGKWGWHGWLPPERYPVIVNPPHGRIWTANARVVDDDMLEVIGDGGYALGARAGQIRDALMARDKASISDMLAIQIDARSRLKQRWAELLLRVLNPKVTASGSRFASLRQIVQEWDGEAGVDSVAHRVVRDFRLWVHNEVLSAVFAGCGSLKADVPRRRLHQLEGPLWKLITVQPAHLLPSQHRSWDALLLAGIEAALGSCQHDSLASCNWGEVNKVRITHPLTRALPALGVWLDVHDGPLPGDVHAPRVQSRVTGASERFAVSPGDEKNGYLHMPGGQSGHPLSPFYRAGHDAWVNGDPTPFLPGRSTHSLSLSP